MLTDKDIIKALHTACFSDLKNIFIRNYITGETTILNMDDILNLINRQQAENKELAETIHNLTIEKDELFDRADELKTEIERLEKRNIKNCRNWQSKYYLLRTKAIKEFAEKLKELDGCNNHTFDDCVSLLVSEEYKKGRYEKTNEIWITINNLVKEMVGEDNV